LTHALAHLNPPIADEVEVSIRRELPPCDDWTSVNFNQKLLRIVALVSGRVFIGTELSRTEEYIDAAINYTVELRAAQEALARTSPWIRPFVGHRLPEVKKLAARLVQTNKLSWPLLRRQRDQDDRCQPRPRVQREAAARSEGEIPEYRRWGWGWGSGEFEFSL
jgi:hypothetical protein